MDSGYRLYDNTDDGKQGNFAATVISDPVRRCAGSIFHLGHHDFMERLVKFAVTLAEEFEVNVVLGLVAFVGLKVELINRG